MDKNEVLDRIEALMNLDHDAAQGYERAIYDIDNQDIRQQIELFKQDHEYHVQDYRDIIEQIAGKTGEPKRDLKGVFLEAMAGIQSEMGMRSALKVLEAAEKTINARYHAALQEDFPVDLKDVLERNYADERRHLDYIQQALQKEAAA